MEQILIEHIQSQRAEAEAYTAAAPGNFMGKLPCHTDDVHCSPRVRSATMEEYQRIDLEESAYYLAADAMSKSYARSLDFSTLTNDQLIDFCAQMTILMRADAA